MSSKARNRANKEAAQDTALVQKLDREREEKEQGDAHGYALPYSSLPGHSWLKKFFPHIATAAPGERHKTLWNWIDKLRSGVKPKSKIDIWPRGGAKSSTAELGVAKAGAALNRRFALYICETQDQADEHVQNIGALFEEMGVERAVNKYGSSKGWKRDELRTANGFNVSGIGLDVAKRGVRLGKYRPDFIIIDDVDGLNDTPATTKKKIRILTQSLLPAGSSDCAVLFVQNKIIATGIAAQLADGTADFLANREPVVEEPAIRGMEVKRVQAEDGTWLWKIIAGVATWVGQSIKTCEAQIAEWGYSSFLREAQHKVDLAEGGLWNEETDIAEFRIFAAGINDALVSSLTKIVVAVDPNGSAQGDDAGIVVAGAKKIGNVIHAYVLESMALPCSPDEWATATDGFVVDKGAVLGNIDGVTIKGDWDGSTNADRPKVALFAHSGSRIYCGTHMKTLNFYYGVQAARTGFVLADGIIVDGAGDVGVFAYEGGTVSANGCSVSNCRDTTNDWGWGIEAEVGGTVHCDNAVVTTCRKGGIFANGGRIRAYSATSNSNTGHGWQAERGGFLEVNGSCQGNSNGGDGWHIDSKSSVESIDNGLQARTNTGAGFWIYNGSSVKATGASILNNNAYGIDVFGQSYGNFYQSTVTGNGNLNGVVAQIGSSLFIASATGSISYDPTPNNTGNQNSWIRTT